MTPKDAARETKARLARALERARPWRDREEQVGPDVEAYVPPEDLEPRDEDLPGPQPLTEEEIIPTKHIEGAMALLRRGLRESPELRAGLGYTLGLALALTAVRVIIPVLVQQILDRGLLGPEGFRPRFVYSACLVAAGLVVFVYFAGRATYRRLVRASESALAALRVRAFAHIHRLSIAEQSAEKRGAFVSRVTADIDTLGQFLEWGAISWVTSAALMLGTALVMFVYSWRLTLLALLAIVPLFVVLRVMQRGMLAAYDMVRTRVGETLSAVSESLMGAAVVRAYGLEEQTNRKLQESIQRRYKAEMQGAKYMASIFPMADLFGAAAVATVVGFGAVFGPGWGVSLGDMIALIFLVSLFVQPLSELSETFDQTQTAIAGWRKVLGLLDLPVELVEPSPGEPLPPGALSVRTEGLEFGYRDGGGPVLRGIDLQIPAGSHVAVVGETGHGKTTFAKLLCRLADPTEGRIAVGDVDLRQVAPDARRRGIRMVPQDGFLFDTTIRENVRFGLEGATDDQVGEAFRRLGLQDWVRGLPEGLDTPVGERGESLSVGERQLVALVRAQMGDPGLLILDEATSAVDPETERALAEALERLSEGRTTVTIAHRMSTAESAEQVLVFHEGRIVERGRHAALVAAGGIYASLYRSWLGNTQGDGEPRSATGGEVMAGRSGQGPSGTDDGGHPLG
jgi:putative ABC transport system ATP-binding protein